MTLKYDLYLKSADVDAVKACYVAIRPLYNLYTPTDIAEAHHQIRRELDLIVEQDLRKKRISALKAELEDQDISE